MPRRMYLHLASVPVLTVSATPDRVTLDYRLVPNGSVSSLKFTRREARRIARDILDLSRVPREART